MGSPSNRSSPYILWRRRTAGQCPVSGQVGSHCPRSPQQKSHISPQVRPRTCRYGGGQACRAQFRHSAPGLAPPTLAGWRQTQKSRLRASAVSGREFGRGSYGSTRVAQVGLDHRPGGRGRALHCRRRAIRGPAVSRAYFKPTQSWGSRPQGDFPRGRIEHQYSDVRINIGHNPPPSPPPQLPTTKPESTDQ